jgi:hypothetical protein
MVSLYTGRNVFNMKIEIDEKELSNLFILGAAIGTGASKAKRDAIVARIFSAPDPNAFLAKITERAWSGLGELLALEPAERSGAVIRQNGAAARPIHEPR